MQNNTDNINTSLLGSDSFKSDDTFGYSDTTQVSLSVALRGKKQEMNACSLPMSAMDDIWHCTTSEPLRSHRGTESSLLSTARESYSSSIGDLTIASKLVFPWMVESMKKSKQKSHSFCDSSSSGGYNRFVAVRYIVNGNQRTKLQNI